MRDKFTTASDYSLVQNDEDRRLWKAVKPIACGGSVTGREGRVKDAAILSVWFYSLI